MRSTLPTQTPKAPPTTAKKPLVAPPPRAAAGTPRAGNNVKSPPTAAAAKSTTTAVATTTRAASITATPTAAAASKPSLVAATPKMNGSVKSPPTTVGARPGTATATTTTNRSSLVSGTPTTAAAARSSAISAATPMAPVVLKSPGTLRRQFDAKSLNSGEDTTALRSQLKELFSKIDTDFIQQVAVLKDKFTEIQYYPEKVNLGEVLAEKEKLKNRLDARIRIFTQTLFEYRMKFEKLTSLADFKALHAVLTGLADPKNNPLASHNANITALIEKYKRLEPMPDPYKHVQTRITELTTLISSVQSTVMTLQNQFQTMQLQSMQTQLLKKDDASTNIRSVEMTMQAQLQTAQAVQTLTEQVKLLNPSSRNNGLFVNGNGDSKASLSPKAKAGSNVVPTNSSLSSATVTTDLKF